MKTILWIFVCIFTLASMCFPHSSCCKLPAQGATGPQGAQGTAGPQGAQGAMGSAAAQTFAYVSLEDTQIVPHETAVLFNLEQVMQGGVSYDSGTGTFTLASTGYYWVKYGLSASPNNDHVALQLNGVTIDGSIMDIQSSIMQGIGVIFEVTVAPSTLTLFNIEISGNITISSSTAGSTDAYFEIEKL